MFENFIHNIFANNYQSEIDAGSFNHCSSVCPYNQGTILAWYAGSSECRDDQSVNIVFRNNKGIYSDPVRLGDKTGNPVVWSDRDHTYLLWSKFEDSSNIRNIVDRWKFCSLWIQQIEFKDQIIFIDEPIQIASSDKHLLGRCNPLLLPFSSSVSYLLPLYDELARNNVIYTVNYSAYDRQHDPISPNVPAHPLGHYYKISTLGTDMIQPTLWTSGGRIHSLSRNFGPNKATMSKYCFSEDNGFTWSKPQNTNIPNRNSSLHAVNCREHVLLLWNDTNTVRRINLQLGLLTIDEGIPKVERLQIISDYGGYPSMCVDQIGDLHMTFSNSQRKIEHHVWNSKHLNTVISDRRRNPVK